MSKNIAVFTTLAMLTSACGESSKAPEPAGPRLAVEFELLENLPRGRFDAAITLVNRGSTALPASGWELFFNFGRGPLPETLPSSVALTHVNGDFYRLAPDGGIRRHRARHERASAVHRPGLADQGGRRARRGLPGYGRRTRGGGRSHRLSVHEPPTDQPLGGRRPPDSEPSLALRGE